MFRTLAGLLAIFVVVWAPWMDSRGSDAIAAVVFDAFGPMPSTCYDSDDHRLQEGVSVRWYPLGRLVHTCTGDYVVWMWGAVREAGGVYKNGDALRPSHGKVLTCEEVMKRQEGRRATSTDAELVYYDGEPADEPNFSIFPAAVTQRPVILNALKAGPSFAGSFAVAEWSCGSNCQNHAVIDVASGLVIAHDIQTEYGALYSLDSTLFVTNPVERLPELPTSRYETETLALAVARLPREYYRLTTDALSGTQYLVRLCVENSAAGYVEVEDDRLGVIEEEVE